MNLRAFSLGALLCAFATVASSADDTLNGFKIFGYTVESKVNEKSCRVEMKLDQQKLLENFEALQKLGIFNDSLPKTRTREIPFTLSLAFVMQAMPVITRSFYESNESSDKCTFSQTINVIDDYGNDKKLGVIDYKFNRSLFNKINWDKFDPSKVAKVFPAFDMKTEFASKLVEERDK